ncbi:formate/nitrite transporter family protein [Lacrimispora sp. NSJ-141]|uniref:Formate/nitrite transporter family protein n=1 Tax=Lientehia hominis TaxID=2897778 RepID=A0AAP2W9M3_9FIRM|nr:formate/nitrite transporter family protein [Lientehia hominis]MCD2492087.1 formate/nitrite transporter family protein [Lientehia hominis]
MFKDEFQAVANAGKNKLNFMKNNPLGYFISAMVAGMFIGLGGLISFTMGGIMTAAGADGAVKITTSFLFASALSLVIMAGAELFTGNNFVMSSAAMKKEISWSGAIKLWVFCYVGNLVGSILISVLFHFTKVPTGDVGTYFATAAAAKASAPALVLFFKGIICNICVCLAVWCGIKMKSETGKLIMTVWCIMIFMVCSCEHSIANMTFFSVGLLDPNGVAISIGGVLNNLLFVTLGNMVGGIVFTALPYYLISRK